MQVAGTLGPQSHAISLVSDSSTPHVRPVTLKPIVLPELGQFQIFTANAATALILLVMVQAASPTDMGM